MHRTIDDTIVALSTPPGRSALAVVRISGPSVIKVLKSLSPDSDFSGNPRKALYSVFTDASGNEIDRGIAVYFKGPASYTGEDTAEISVHGNPVIVKRLITACLRCEGVRPAEAGEFTLRSYLSGKMDLTQAEAVRRIIDARTERELESGRRMLSGELSRELARFRSHLLNLKAEAEAEVDFAGEDLTFRSREERNVTVEELISRISHLTESSRRAYRGISDFRIVFAGAPNAGKSSLLNRLIGWDRAMVSETAGTTRDFISESVEIEGIPVRLTDTAGIRESEDPLEKEGIRRSVKEIANASLILFVADTKEILLSENPELNIEIKRIAVENKEKIFFVMNKSENLSNTDRERAADKLQFIISGAEAERRYDLVFVSCLTGEGIAELDSLLRKWIHERSLSGGDSVLLEERHLFHLEKTSDALRKVICLWEEGAPDEITAIELDTALEHIGLITGSVSNEEILGRIFSLFCIGK